MKEPSATIYTDGASRGNPGNAAWAYIILQNDVIVKKDSGYCEFATNNQAEYWGLIKALEFIADKYNPKQCEVNINSDSLLMINQMKGIFKVKNENIKPLYLMANRLSVLFSIITFSHVRREHNTVADSILNEVLDSNNKEE